VNANQEQAIDRKRVTGAAWSFAKRMDRLDAAENLQDMNLPGFKFHPLSGNKKGRYAVWVTGNWRITFVWDESDAVAVDYEDYHGK